LGDDANILLSGKSSQMDPFTRTTRILRNAFLICALATPVQAQIFKGDFTTTGGSVVHLDDGINRICQSNYTATITAGTISIKDASFSFPVEYVFTSIPGSECDSGFGLDSIDQSAIAIAARL
jgi:hypothetical protein